MDRVLAIRLSSMGDIIHTLPAVAALRRAFPLATLGWVVEERWAELLCARNNSREPAALARSPEKPLVEIVHVVNTKAWRSAPFSDATWKEMLSTKGELQSANYQAAIDFQGAIRSAVLAQIAGIPSRFGFARPRERAAGLWYTTQVAARGTHIAEQNLSLACALAGQELEMPACELPRDPAAEAWCERELQQRNISDFAILTPGAGWGAKCWPPERYGAVAKNLAAEGFRSIVNFGPGEEPLARAVEAASGGAAQAIACSLGELTALARRARIFIGGDTGPLHLAAALRIPVVALYGPTDPVRNGPIGTRCIVLRSPESPTSHARRSRPDVGMLTITPEQVIVAVHTLLGPHTALQAVSGVENSLA